MAEVTMRDVLVWLLAALEAARADTGSEEGRQLSIIIHAGPGAMNIEFVTWNPWRKSPRGRREYGRETSDGVLVVWSAEPPEVPTGKKWLPEGFVSWMKGGGNG